VFLFGSADLFGVGLVSELKNDCLIRSLLKEPASRTPVWMMRQAGRHLPEYRKLRRKAGDFMSLCRDPKLACEIAMQPLRRYELDAAILFSDILTIPDAMGLGLHFVEGEGPKFRKPLRTERDIKSLSVINSEDDLAYVLEAVSLIRKELDGSVPLIGFAGSPWTLAAYMIEGKSSRDFVLAKTWLYKQPEILHQLLQKLTLSLIDYLNAQIVSGAQVIQISDTWGGILSDAAYEQFSLAYIREIITNLIPRYDDREVPVVLFTKSGGNWLEEIAASGCNAIGLDWTISLREARRRVGARVALQGNMDPTVLRSNPKCIESEVRRILDSYGSGSGHVFNLGHGITPDIDPFHVSVFIEAVHRYSGN
jgi:uroporphyrinogen decarboxylase